MSGNSDEDQGVGTGDSVAGGDSPSSAEGSNGGAAAGDATASEPQEPEEVIANLREKMRAQHERLLRAAADLENFKKRSAREKEQYVQRAGESLARDLLPVVDNMDRALEHAEKSIDEKNLREGVLLIHKQLMDTLAKHGIEPFDAMGEKFDPMRHEALSQVPSTDAEPGSVVQQFARGYTIRGHLLRPAMVVVAKAPAADESDSDEGGAEGTSAAWDAGKDADDSGGGGSA